MNFRYLLWFLRIQSLIELRLLCLLIIQLVRIHFTLVNQLAGTTTGISAHDRALTARKLADPQEQDGSVFSRPGHIFPLRYHEGGVLQRAGHTEASVGELL